jgi:hypothetical protein
VEKQIYIYIYIYVKHTESRYLRLISCLGLYDVIRGNIEE